jgi:anti-anti-sigma factor
MSSPLINPLGARIYETLLVGKVPKNIDGLIIKVAAIPSQDISGDFFEFYRPSKSIVDIAIGDVMGKGIPAALVGTVIKTQLMRFAIPFTHIQSYSKETSWQDDMLKPEEILYHVHHEIVPQLIQLEYFVSLFYGRFNLYQQMLTFVDCGSTKPIHYKTSLKQAVTLTGEDLPLGIVEEAAYNSSSVPYEKGDFFIFYSDGVTEAKALDHELYGIKRLISLVENNPEVEAEVLLNLIKDSVLNFTKKKSLDHDLMLIVIKVSEMEVPISNPLNLAKFFSSFSQLKAVREFVDRLCRQAPGNNYRLSSQLQLAINEAFCNIVKHGYGEENGGIILLYGELCQDGILFELSDQGRDFNPAEVREPSWKGDQTNGFGCYIIREIADRITYIHKESEQGWNHLRIFKHYVPKGASMQLAYSTQDNILIISPQEDVLDANDASEFKAKVIDLIHQDNYKQVIFDLQHLNFVDSSGLGALLSVLRALHSRGGVLKLACLSKPLRTMFELVSMHKIFDIFNSIDEAVKSFKQTQNI